MTRLVALSEGFLGAGKLQTMIRDMSAQMMTMLVALSEGFLGAGKPSDNDKRHVSTVDDKVGSIE